MTFPPRPSEQAQRPQYMRVIHDFTSRNSKELTIRKGETVEASGRETDRPVPLCDLTLLTRLVPQLLDMSRQWWKVRDSRGEVGYVPNNVLEPYEEPHQVGSMAGVGVCECPHAI